MTRRRSPASSAWSTVALAVAVGASTALTARGLVQRRRRRHDPSALAPPLPAHRLPAPPGARRPGDG